MSLQTRLASLAQAIGADIKALNTKVVTATTAFDTWHTVGAAGEPAFLNGWVSQGASFTPRFRKFPDGRVRLAGVVKSGTSGTAVFNLPVGYRPPYGDAGFTTPSSAGVGLVDIVASTGAVVVTMPGTYQYIEVEFDTATVTELSVLIAGVAQNAVLLDPMHNVGAAGEPAFQNTWTNLDTTRQTAGFRKTAEGKVQLKGTVKIGTTSAGQTPIFTLPVGYRPPKEAWFTVPSNVGSGSSIKLEIDPLGVVRCPSAATSGQSLTLDGVEIDTESVTQMPTGPQGPKGDSGGVDVLVTLDWNTAITTNFFRSRFDETGLLPRTVNGPGDTLNPPPSLGYAIAHQNGTITQYAWDLDTKLSWTRFRSSAGVWSAWVTGLTKTRLDTDLMTGGATPADGDERYFQNAAMKAQGVMWKFRYNAASTSQYKWEFVGGQRLSVRSTGVFSTASNAVYVNTGTSLGFPLSGDYKAYSSGRGGTSALGNRIYSRLAITGPGTVSGNDMVLIGSGNTSNDATDKNLANEYDLAGVASGAAVYFQAMTQNGAYTIYIGYAGISILPTRVEM